MAHRDGNNNGARVPSDGKSNIVTDKLHKQIEFGDTHGESNTASDDGITENYTQAKGAGKPKNRLYIGTVSAVLCIALACGIAFAVYKGLFRISVFNVSGNGSTYSADELMAAMGISYGDGLYSFSKNSAEHAVMRKYPEINSVKFELIPPSTVNVSLSFTKEVFYVNIYGEFWTLDGDFRLINAITAADASARGLIKLIIPEITSAVAGNVIEFSNQKAERYMKKFSSALLGSSLSDRLSAADISDVYNMKLVCDKMYLVTLGDSDTLEEKLLFTEAVLADRMFSSGNKATIDVSNISEASVIINNQLDLDW